MAIRGGVALPPLRTVLPWAGIAPAKPAQMTSNKPQHAVWVRDLLQQAVFSDLPYRTTAPAVQTMKF
jgi:hypothetical protein